MFGAMMPMGAGGFEEDPVFGSANRMMRQMDTMMSSMMQDPFSQMMGRSSMMGGPPMMGGMMGGQLVPRQQQQQQQQLGLMGSNNMNALNLMGNPMAMMNGMMSNMDHMRGESSSQVFSSSSVMSMTTGPDGRPQIKMANKTDGSKNHTKFEGGRATQVYQSSSTSRGGPGGVRETQHSVSDSRTGVKKLAIGHHIGDRSRIVEKERNREGDEEREELVNLDDEETDDFESEFRRASGGHHHRNAPAAIDNTRTRNAPLAIENGGAPAPRYSNPRSIEPIRLENGVPSSSANHYSASRHEPLPSNDFAHDRYGVERINLNRPTGIDASNFDRRQMDRAGMENIEYHRPNTNYTPAPSTYVPRHTSYSNASSYLSRPYRASQLRRPVSSYTASSRRY